MKFKELSALPVEELRKKIIDARAELMKLNAQVATGTNPKSPGQVRLLRRTIARIETTLKQRKTGGRTTTNG